MLLGEGLSKSVPGKQVACNHGLISMSSGLRGA